MFSPLDNDIKIKDTSQREYNGMAKCTTQKLEETQR